MLAEPRVGSNALWEAKMLNVLLVEDDLDLAAALLDMMALENIGCDHASNGLAGLQLLQQNRYDLVVLDLNLPRLDGLSLCRQLRQQGDDTVILMLTARDSLADKLDGFDAGGDDYLVKPFEVEELLARMRVLARRRSGQIRMLNFGDIYMQLDAHIAQRGQRELSLSPIAWRLLECLIRAAPNPVPREQLIATVWGEAAPDSNSLKVHIHKLRKALEQGGEAPCLRHVAGAGFALFKSTEPPAEATTEPPCD